MCAKQMLKSESSSKIWGLNSWHLVLWTCQGSWKWGPDGHGAVLLVNCDCEQTYRKTPDSEQNDISRVSGLIFPLVTNEFQSHWQFHNSCEKKKTHPHLPLQIQQTCIACPGNFTYASQWISAKVRHVQKCWRGGTWVQQTVPSCTCSYTTEGTAVCYICWTMFAAECTPRDSQISSSLQFEQILCKYHSCVNRPLFHYALENFPPSGVSPAVLKT